MPIKMSIAKKGCSLCWSCNATVEKYLCSGEIPLNKYLKELYFSGETIVVRPKYWNQRIANQAGVFMLFPNSLLDKYKGIIQHADSLGLENAIKQYGRSSIDKNILQSILQKENVYYYRQEEERCLTEKCFKEIIKAYIGIGTDYIYPELEYTAKENKSQYV